MKHHYVPQFYLRRWAQPDNGKVWEFSRPFRKVVARQRATSETCQAAGLYSLDGFEDREQREYLELSVMQRIDHHAARALSHMISTGKMPPDQIDRDGWITFLLSLLHRSPARLAYLDERARVMPGEMREQLAPEYLARRSDADPPTLEDYLDQRDDQQVAFARTILMVNLMSSGPVGQTIAKMSWHFIDVAESKHDLLTCDEPLVTSNGIGHQFGYIALPVGPRHLFMAVQSEPVISAFAAQRPTDLVRGFNDCICKQAERLVIGRSKGHQSFVERRLGRHVDEKRAGLQQRFTWNPPIA